MSRSQRLILTIAILASFVAFLDGTLINVALPAIETELGGGLTTQQWVVDAYLITLGSLILLAGSISDAFGRLLVLRIGLYGFAAASVVIAIAPDPVILIIARAVQGGARSSFPARWRSSPRASTARCAAGRSASGRP